MQIQGEISQLFIRKDKLHRDKLDSVVSLVQVICRQAVLLTCPGKFKVAYFWFCFLLLKEKKMNVSLSFLIAITIPLPAFLFHHVCLFPQQHQPFI